MPNAKRPKNKNEARAITWTVLLPSDIDVCLDWVLDSSCSQHITYDTQYFTSFNKDGGKAIIVDRKELNVLGRSTIELQLSGQRVQIPDVLYVPSIGFNLLSIAQLIDRGITTLFLKDKVEIHRNNTLLATSVCHRCSYILKRI
jgi:hypothetical protein